VNTIAAPFAAVAAVVLLAAFVDPAIAAALIAALTFSRAPAVALHSANVLPAVLAVALAIAAAARWRREHDPEREAPRRALSFAIAALPYLAILALSYLWADNPTLTVTAVQQLALVMLLCVAFIVLLCDTRALHWAITGIIVGGVFLALLSLHQVATGSYGSTYGGFAVAQVENIAGTTEAPRIGGPFADPNFFGQLMVVPVAFALQRLSAARRWTGRAASLTAVGLCVVTLGLTYSRGALVALAVVGAMWVGTLPIARRRSLLVAAGIGVVVIGSVIAPRAYLDRIAQVRDVVPGLARADASTRDDALLGRQSALIAGWRMFTDHPVVGVGAGNYTAHYLDYAADIGLFRSGEQLAPHSLVTEIASETGLIGLVAFGAIVVCAYDALRRSRRSLLVIGCYEDGREISAIRNALTGYLVASVFLHAAYPHMLWLLLALAWATPQTVPTSIDDEDVGYEETEALRSTV
jgi:O-antigen ligase